MGRRKRSQPSVASPPTTDHTGTHANPRERGGPGRGGRSVSPSSETATPTTDPPAIGPRTAVHSEKSFTGTSTPNIHALAPNGRGSVGRSVTSSVGNAGPSAPSGPTSVRRSVTPPKSSSDTNIHTIIKAQIVFLMSTLTEDTFVRNQTEIRSLVEQHGLDTYLHFIRRLIVHSQARLSPSAVPSAFELSTSLTFRLLVQETRRLARDPLIAERFRDGINMGEGDLFRSFDLVRFSDRVGLCPLERLVLAASIVSAPTREELATQALMMIQVEFDNAVLELRRSPCFAQDDLSSDQVAKLMSNLSLRPTV
ncbi:hypothetical protein B0H14DRAFT_402409 [Mycena olivaceomarginata]|nr:hypothetical protein B0H14DRAFT_402409 [Mycena olivaceomarginata]